MTIEQLQQQVDAWINKYGVRYFSELTNTVILMEETGELARLVARKFGEQSFKNEEDDTHAMHNIADELADIVFVIVCLANQMDINLEQAIKANLDKKTRRDEKRHIRNPKL